MKKKTIRSICENKLKDWVESVDDAKVKKAIRHSAIITGGSIASMLLGEDVNDFDVYFKNKKDLKIVCEYYAKDFSEVLLLDGADNHDEEEFNGEGLHLAISNLDGDRLKFWTNGAGGFETVNERVNDGKFLPLFFSGNSITLQDDLQIVVRFWGEVDEVHKNYDYIHATCSYDFSTNTLNLRREAMESLLTKDLLYTGSKYPICSIIRSKKFIKRGWKISAGQYLKMAFHVSQLDLTDMQVLEEQLEGVDIAYFSALIKALHKVDGKKLKNQYIFKIIDKIFND